MSQDRIQSPSRRWRHLMPEGIEVLSQSAAGQFEDEWYELADESHFWCQWRLIVLHQLLKDLNIPISRPETKVLDIGCGIGTLRSQLESGTRWAVDAADLNMNALKCAKTSRGRTLFYNVLDRDPALRERYDVVVLFDVLEHIENADLFLEGALAHLKTNGLVLVNVPSLPIFYSLYDRMIGHVRRYDKTNLLKILRNNKVVVEDVRYWGLSLVPMLAARKLLMPLQKSPQEQLRMGFAPGKFLNDVFKEIMKLETFFCSRPWLGASLMAAGRKQ